MLKNLIVFILLFLTLGCATTIPDAETSFRSMYNIASTGESQFDSTKYIRLRNMLCPKAVMFALYQDTGKSKKGFVLLRAGTNFITNIADGESLHIKLDGKTYSFSSTDYVTEHDSLPAGYGGTFQFSHKTFVIPEEIVREAASSEVFLAKINLLNNTFIEGKCSPSTLQEVKEQNKQFNLDISQEYIDTANKYSALNGFREFVKMMDTTLW